MSWKPIGDLADQAVEGLKRLETMRADFLLIAADRQAHQGWSAADAAELGAEIKAAIEGGDETAREAWACYLAAEAAPLRAMAQTCREAEARIRAQREQERRKAA